MTRRAIVIFLTLFLLIGAAIAQGAGERLAKVRVAIESRADYLALKSLRLDEVYQGEKYIDVLVVPEEIARLEQSGLRYSVEAPDLTAFFQSRFDPSRDMGGYRTLSEIYLAMDSIANQNPLIVRGKWSIGNTLENRPIYVMKISDNALLDEDEPEVYYYGAIHAREVITPELLIYFMRYLTNNYGIDPQVTYLVDNRELFFSTVVNPDGYYHNEVIEPGGGGLWRKNRRNNGDGSYGIDLNRNFGYQWGYDDEGSSPNGSSETYRGASAFSEPETQRVRDFMISRNFVIALSYHSYGNYFLWPWGYDQVYTPDNDIFQTMGDSIRAQTNYAIGPPWQLLYPVNGSTDDWGYGEQTLKDKTYAVTIEVGTQSDDFWPPTSRITPLVQANIYPNLFVARIADKPEKLRVPAQPQIYPLGIIEANESDVYWHHADTVNPAISYELWQMQGFTRTTDDIEAISGNWIANGFTVSTTRAHSGTKSYFGGSAANLNNRLTAFNKLSVQAGDSLKFWTWYDIETNWDYGYVEVSTNSGSTWASIPGNITTNTNPNGNNLGNGITGLSSSWVEAKFSLAAYVGQDIGLRFRYVTDGFVNDPGWWIDDIYPVEGYATETMLSNSITDTTYHVTGLSAGDYFYRVRAKDAEAQWSAFSPVENLTVNLCTWKVGDANGDDTYSISDAIYVISYVFSGGPSPMPHAIGSGDLDCTGAVDISDAVYIINYIFAGGPPPAPSCECGDYL